MKPPVDFPKEEHNRRHTDINWAQALTGLVCVATIALATVGVLAAVAYALGVFT